MSQSQTYPETVLRLQRTFSASRERVFDAWTNPEELKNWFAPSDTYRTPEAEVDLRVGGRYRIRMESADGKAHQVAGVYHEIQVPEKLVFTWGWEFGGMDQEETLVTVEFSEVGENGTEVVLTHERFSSIKARDEHKEGWSGCLERLTKLAGD